MAWQCGGRHFAGRMGDEMGLAGRKLDLVDELAFGRSASRGHWRVTG